MLSDPEKGCGEGNMTQTRSCTNGNIENCVDTFEERQINLPCSVPCTITGIIVSFDIKFYKFAKYKMYTITYSFNINVNITFSLVKGAAKTTTKNDSETIETTDTTRKTDDQKTNPNKDGNMQ